MSFDPFSASHLVHLVQIFLFLVWDKDRNFFKKYFYHTLAQWRFWRNYESLQWFYWKGAFHIVGSTFGLFWNCFDYQGLYFTKLKDSSQKHNFSLLQKPSGKNIFSEKSLKTTIFRNYYLIRFDCRVQVMVLQQHIHILHKPYEIFWAFRIWKLKFFTIFAKLVMGWFLSSWLKGHSINKKCMTWFKQLHLEDNFQEFISKRAKDTNLRNGSKIVAQRGILL